MTSEKVYFQEDWLQYPDYKDWIAPDTHAKTKSRCKRCCKSFEFSNMGVQAVKSHSAGIFVN